MRKIIIPALLFIISFAICTATVQDYGLTWDEPYYIVHSQRMAKWFELLRHSDAPFSDENIHTYWNYDRYHNCHPPFYKLSGMAAAKLAGLLAPTDPLNAHRLSTVFWAALLVVGLYFYLLRVYAKPLVAIFGSLLFIATPRFFAHAHLYATDMLIAALSFISLYMIYYWRRNNYAVILIAAVSGALLAVKFTGILIFPLAALAFFASHDKRRFLQFYGIFFSLTWVFFFIFNPHAWFSFGAELRFYFQSVLQRESVVPIATLYFGDVFRYRLPWHQPLVMLGIAIPAATVGLALVGMLSFANKPKRRELWFEGGSVLLLMAVYMLPNTPKHDGIRLFSTIWPFLIVLSIRGMATAAQLAGRRIAFSGAPRPHGEAIILYGLSLVVLLASAVACYTHHPYQLSFYNTLIGGTRGAEAQGFSVSYWYDALDRKALGKIAARLQANPGKLYSFPHNGILAWNKRLGLIDTPFLPTDNFRNADYTLVLNRIVPGALKQKDLFNNREVIAAAPDGTPLLELVETRKDRKD